MSMKVRLRVNMILSGKWYKVGSVLDADRIPEHLRKRRYVELISESEPVLILTSTGNVPDGQS